MANYEVFRAEILQKDNIFSISPGITLRIELKHSRVQKSLQTKIGYKSRVRECALENGDEVKAYVSKVQPTKITSGKCNSCPFGGNKPPNPQIVCNIFQRNP